jgi:hypothetical protein
MASIDLLSLLVGAATVLIYYFIWRATQLQFVASMAVGFQNEWHNPRAVLMRDYLHSAELQGVLNNAIKEAYGTPIPYTYIPRLLDRTELKGSDTDQLRLEKFDTYLKGDKAKYKDPCDPSKTLFVAYQALYEVLLSFDRLAVVRDQRFMMKKWIKRYKPPIRDLAPVLQAFIAVRSLLRPPDLRNYKKDYMFLLGKLGLHDGSLLEKCKQGLIERGELDDRELKEIERIQQAG